MKTIDILLAGVGGYGMTYVNFFRNGIFDGKTVRICGIADPYVSRCAGYDWIKEQGIPLYDSPSDFFKEHRADLVVISTPTELHRPYSMIAMENGCDVLCEKPLVPTVQELDQLEKDRARLSKALGVGFQWSYCDTMGNLKKDILDGAYGAPKLLKTFISWPRTYSYYRTSTWKGRVRDGKGSYILDSIVTNATAHYLHNIFFLLGDTMETAACPESIEAELYRAKDIESFDTCFLKGRVGGAQFYYAASHATEKNLNPKFRYEFEKGVVTFNEDGPEGHVIGTFRDGRRVDYGDPFTEAETAKKLEALIAYQREGAPLRCTIPTVRPHLLACNAVFDFGKVKNFPEELLVTVNEEDPQTANLYCKGLFEDLYACYQEGLLPSEKKISWSDEPVKIDLTNYDHFNGGAF